jgi:type III restriction enzyme
LTVIASESYESFARGLQDELVKSIGERPKKVEIKIFENAPYLRKDGSEGRMSEQLATQLNFCLIQSGYVDMNGQLTQKFKDDKASGTVDFGADGDKLDVKVESIIKILDRVFNPEEGSPSNGLEGRRQALNYERFNSSEFKKLWEHINGKSAYTVTFDSDDLVRKSVAALDEKLYVPAVEFVVTTGELESADVTKESLASGAAMKTTARSHERAKLSISPNYRCDLIGEIVDETGLTRTDVARILSGVRPETFAQFKANPEAFILRAATLINEQKANVIIKDITYSKVEGKFEENVFSERPLTAYPDSRQVRDTKKGVYDLFVLDSDVEVGFCKGLYNL